MEAAESLVSQEPWASALADVAEASSCCRPSLVVPERVYDVSASTVSEALPELGRWTEEDGRLWRRLELPATGTESEGGPATESLSLLMRAEKPIGKATRLVLREGLPRLRYRGQANEEDETDDPWRLASDEAMGLIGQHIDLVNELYDSAKTESGDGWQGHVNGLAVLRHSAALKMWAEAGLADEPRKALIVRLAEDRGFRLLLADVCHRPRRVLSRERHLQNIARVQEMDPACIRWMVRQPGVSLAQKAGVRQEVLGVIRIENADTPENRVIRDLLQRAIWACTRYIRENDRYGNHERVVAVRRLRRELRALRTRSAIVEARPLVGIAYPNYVLQHDVRYKPLWAVYEKLRRQQMQQDEVWRWRHGVWSEHCYLAIAAALDNLATQRSWPAADMLVRSEQAAGRFIDPRSVPPPAERGGEHIDLVPARGVHEHEMVPDAVAKLCPDMVLVRRSRYGGRLFGILCVWTAFDFSVERDRMPGRVQAISEALRACSSHFRLGGLLIQPTAHRGEGGVSSAVVAAGQCQAVRFASGLQANLAQLTHAVARGLQIGGVA